ncbi:hypothetical protein [Sphingosinicella terrae]|uniref:hypothetical protein n=1 Tax=Sphingosinicella terrae TaxID=2172047 RepID=UPI000E0DBA25|nr:hypothetical protein [Sphingosinicella terrae]
MTTPSDTGFAGDSGTTARTTSPETRTQPSEPYVEMRIPEPGEAEQAREAGIELPLIPIPFPVFTVSGRYVYSRAITLPTPIPLPRPLPIERIPIPRPGPGRAESDEAAETVYDEDINAISLYQREEVRFDVDGRYPQMTISGTRSGFLTVAGHWIASVRKTASGSYEGPIWYKDGATGAIAHTHVSAKVTGGLFPASRKLEITFTGGGAAAFTRSYAFESGYHRGVEFEYDRVSNAVAVTSVNTHAHPNRPASLPAENLTIETVFRRAGFDVSVSPGGGVIPIGAAGPDAAWTDQEMHDAMQIHWSRFANKPQWAMWVLFARLHVSGTSLGGIMFDDIGPNHRQGTAIFSHAFIAQPPAGDPAPAAWVERMRFWTAVHEMGHSFNLAHSWQKSLGTPWIALANEPEARSFMNYPYNVAGGQNAFFANFDYRFSNAELLFTRHAPERFVQMGNENWFSNHGFREAAQHSHPDYELRLTTSRADDRFPYLAPPVVEIALVNRSERTRTVSSARISERGDFTLVINGERREARLWMPHMRHCGEGDDKVLRPGEAVYDSAMIASGKNGWDLAEPGRYCIQAVIEVDGQPVYSNQLMVTIESPGSREEEKIAADFFTPEVGQVLAANGTRGLAKVTDVLAAAAELEGNPVSQVAALALATPLAFDFKLLDEGSASGAGAGADTRMGARDAGSGGGRRIEQYKADPKAARKLLERAMGGKAGARGAAKPGSADSLVDAVGHTRFLRDAPVIAAIEKAEVPNSTEAFLAFAADGQKAEAAAALPVSDRMQRLLDAKAAGLTQ